MGDGVRFTALAAALGALVSAAACNGTQATPIDDTAGDAGDAEDAKTGPTHLPPPPVVEAGLPPVDGPKLLSETGLYADFAKRTLADGVLAYAPRYPLWSDGSEKKRFVLLPEGAKIQTDDMDHWLFPVGTKAWKEFWVAGKLRETRFLWKTRDVDGWWMVSYVWRDDGSDAEASIAGSPNVGGTTHDIPSQAQCRQCHVGAADFVIGLDAVQLSNGGSGFLTTLAQKGKFTVAPAHEFEVPGDEVDRAALGYLHGNCSYCHNDHTGLHDQSAMRLYVRSTDRNVGETPIMRSVIGLKARHVIPPDVDTVVVPGLPQKSELYYRLAARDSWVMPPLGTKVVDPAAVDVVREWIARMPPRAATAPPTP
ncbi:MAG: hypothetical protein U0235_21890 [Polyangiaceae bacterium]